MDTVKKTNKEIEFAATLTKLLDSAFKIPGTKFTFGLDPILGLIPGLGSGISLIISAILFIGVSRNKVSQKVILLMCLNILADALIGSIPVLGNIFDFVFKANERNIRLLKKHFEEGKYQGSGKGILVLILLGVVGIMMVIIYCIYLLFRFIFSIF